MQTKDKVAVDYKVYETTNYEQFKFLEGNRPVDEKHYKSLAKKMQREGNLMYLRPVEVTENMEIIDGQHRAKAAELNGMPVYYVIQPDTNINTTIIFNTGSRNWTWLNFAESWAGRGNQEYQKFIELQKEYGFRFSAMLLYATGTHVHSNFTKEGELSSSQQFKQGEFKFKDYFLAKKLLQQYADVVKEAGLNTREFAIAMHSFMRRPGYNHELLLEKIRQFGDGLMRCYTIGDFAIELENIYKA